MTYEDLHSPLALDYLLPYKVGKKTRKEDFEVGILAEPQDFRNAVRKKLLAEGYKVKELSGFKQEKQGTMFLTETSVADLSQLDVVVMRTTNLALARVCMQLKIPLIAIENENLNRATYSNYFSLHPKSSINKWVEGVKDVFDYQDYWNFFCNQASLYLLIKRGGGNV